MAKLNETKIVIPAGWDREYCYRSRNDGICYHPSDFIVNDNDSYYSASALSSITLSTIYER